MKNNKSKMLEDYGFIREAMGHIQHYYIDADDYREALEKMSREYGLEYNHEEDIMFYSGEDTDKTYYWECKLLEHLWKQLTEEE